MVRDWPINVSWGFDARKMRVHKSSMGVSWGVDGDTICPKKVLCPHFHCCRPGPQAAAAPTTPAGKRSRDPDTIRGSAKKARVVKEYVCDQCEKRFQRSDKFNEHKEFHEKGKFPCANYAKCHTDFTTKRARNLHQILCLGGKHKYQCTECDKSFPQKAGLDQHVNKKHTDPHEMTQWPCPVCEKPFDGCKFHPFFVSWGSYGASMTTVHVSWGFDGASMVKVTFVFPFFFQCISCKST